MFSLAWMMDSSKRSKGETLQDQFKAAKAHTAPVGGNPGSTVMSYGAVSILTEPVSFFEGSSGSAGSAGSAGGSAGGMGGGQGYEERGSRAVDGEGFNLALFLAKGRVTPTTPWVLEREREQKTERDDNIQYA